MSSKIIYSFYYNTNIFELKINRNTIEFYFPNFPDSYIYINRIDLKYNITDGTSPALEILPNGDFLTSDGYQINISPDNYQVTITLLEDSSSLISYGDGTILLTNNGALDYNDDDRDLNLRPYIFTKSLFLTFFYDLMKFSYQKSVQLDDNSNITTTMEMENIVMFEGQFYGEFIGVNNKYNILSESREPLIPLYADYTINNLDSIFTTT